MQSGSATYSPQRGDRNLIYTGNYEEYCIQSRLRKSSCRDSGLVIKHNIVDILTTHNQN